MKPTAQTSIRIAEPATAGPVSRARKQFNTLIKKLAAMRTRLADWNEAMPLIMRLAEQEYAPLAQANWEHQKALLRLLDRMSAHKSLGKRDRARLGDVICSTALDLLAQHGDADVKEIYNRHSGGDFDADIDDGDAAAKDMLEELMGVQIDDDLDWPSPEAVFEALARRAAEQQQAAEAKAAARPKSASAIAREQRAAAEAAKLKQTVRDIFRKLVSELHPDREVDGGERARKTALMQRVNAAYAANDLLGLLELQLEIEQINQAGLDNLGEERIRQFNKILEGQVRELERETAGMEQLATMAIGRRSLGRVTPQLALRYLRADIAEAQAANASIVAELEDFKSVTRLKAWLKTCRLAPAPDDDVFWY